MKWDDLRGKKGGGGVWQGKPRNFAKLQKCRNVLAELKRVHDRRERRGSMLSAIARAERSGDRLAAEAMRAELSECSSVSLSEVCCVKGCQVAMKTRKKNLA